MVELMGTLQVRDVPDDLSRVLKERAAEAGQSLSEYVLALLRAQAQRPTMDQWLDRVASREPVDLPPDAGADALRTAREERQSELGSL
jgi:plasmid stability protein